MSREIKFRAWDSDDKCWATLFDGVDAKTGRPFYVDPDGVREFDVCENYDVQQYTGLLDRNGVEIYEGDIVCPLEHSNYVVKWYNEEGGGVSTYGYYMEVTGIPGVLASINPIQAKELEVIGNIYENPELLENKNETN